MPPGDVARDDVQWLAGQGSAELSRIVRDGFDLELVHFPPLCAVAVDLRVFDGGLSRMRGLTPAPAVHTVVLLHEGAGATGPPGAVCTAAFVSAAPGARVVVEYSDSTASFTVRVVERESKRPAPSSDDGADLGLGVRGVAVYGRPQSDAWLAVANRLDREALLQFGSVRLNTGVFIADPCAADEGPKSRIQDRLADAAVTSRAEGSKVLDSAVFSCRSLPAMRRSEGMSASEITEFNLDRSAYVSWLVSSRYGGRWSSLVADQQLSFLGFLLLRDVSSLSHWSRLIREVCAACDGLLVDAPEFYDEFCRTLMSQLELVEPDVFASDSEEPFREAVLNMCATAGTEVFSAQRLANAVKKRFRWELYPNLESSAVA